MEDRIWLFSFSGLLIILGVVITVEPEPTLGWYLLSDHDVKLSQEKWIVGPCIFFWGLYGLIKGIRSKPIVKIYYKCLNCGTIFELEKSPNNLCERCNKPLEELNDFFERHPEFKDGL
ncbi:MAG: hypothetical protein HUK40_11095 [Desulfobacter sp.]|nr:hypothetical protein [Desulfobacter sp.]